MKWELKSFDEIGLLINFGENSLNFKRLANKKYKSPESQNKINHSSDNF